MLNQGNQFCSFIIGLLLIFRVLPTFVKALLPSLRILWSHPPKAVTKSVLFQNKLIFKASQAFFTLSGYPYLTQRVQGYLILSACMWELVALDWNGLLWSIGLISLSFPHLLHKNVLNVCGWDLYWGKIMTIIWLFCIFNNKNIAPWIWDQTIHSKNQKCLKLLKPLLHISVCVDLKVIVLCIWLCVHF